MELPVPAPPDDNPWGKPDGCRGCPLFTTGQGFVLGDGPYDASIALIAEAPGEDEVREGRPLVGGSGRVCNKQLALAGIRRSEVFVANVLKCRPPENRTPTAVEVAHCRQYLEQEARILSANVYVACGETALNALTGEFGISQQRGIAIEGTGAFAGRKVLPIFHFAFVMRQQQYWPVNIFDLTRAQRESSFAEIRRAPIRFTPNACVETDGVALLQRARAAGRVTFDIETFGHGGGIEGALDSSRSQIGLMGLGVEPHTAESYHYGPKVHALCSELFGDPSVEKITQNGESFDIPYCEDKGITFRGPTFDTLLAFHATNSSLPKDLGHISSYYVDRPYWKNKKQNLPWYNCEDVNGTTLSALELKRELIAMGMEWLYYKNIMPLQPVLRSMHRLGMKKDIVKAHLWGQAIEVECAKQEQHLREGIGDPTLNIRSPKQLMDLLYNKMGLPVQYTKDAKTKQMRPTANREALEKLATLTDNPIFRLIYEIRSALQQKSTFIDVEADERDFVHPKIGCAKAETGRMNGVDPNPQNVPVWLREIYIPDDPDHVFISADWSQIEWRLMATLGADRVALDLLMQKGIDTHRATASEVLNKPYDAVTTQERHYAKYVVYGLGYGRGAKSIARQYGIPLAIVEAFIAKFSRRFSGVWNMRASLPRFVEQHSYLRNPFGRRRWWYTYQVTEMYNFPAQSTAADMMYQAAIMLYNQLPKGATLRNVVHDDALVCAHRDVAREAAICIKDVMHSTKFKQITEASVNPELVEKYYPGGFTCPAELSLGRHWAECKSDEGKKAQAELRRMYDIPEGLAA